MLTERHNKEQDGPLTGKISAQPHTTVCIQFLDRENSDKNNTLPLGKQICFTIVRDCAEILPHWPLNSKTHSFYLLSFSPPKTSCSTGACIRVILSIFSDSLLILFDSNTLNKEATNSARLLWRSPEWSSSLISAKSFLIFDSSLDWQPKTKHLVFKSIALKGFLISFIAFSSFSTSEISVHHPTQISPKTRLWKWKFPHSVNWGLTLFEYRRFSVLIVFGTCAVRYVEISSKIALNRLSPMYPTGWTSIKTPLWSNKLWPKSILSILQENAPHIWFQEVRSQYLSAILRMRN